MSEAKLSNYRQSPRKVRLVADLVRGKSVQNAVTTLMYTPKRAAKVVKKVIESAVANAKHNEGADERTLFVDEIRVDEGFTLKRHKPRARGRAFGIKKRTSHIMVKLGQFVVDKKPEKEKVAAVKSDTDSKSVKTKKSEVSEVSSEEGKPTKKETNKTKE